MTRRSLVPTRMYCHVVVDQGLQAKGRARGAELKQARLADPPCAGQSPAVACPMQRSDPIAASTMTCISASSPKCALPRAPGGRFQATDP
eukprot:2198151-Prorocentrum_lima.AAC.1